MNFFRKKDAPSDSSAMSPIKEPATEQTTPENERTTEKEQTSEEPPEQTNVVDDDDDESRYPTAFPFALITLALCLSIFCMSLDNTIIATAIPQITDDLDSILDVGWYGSAYLLCICAFQLFFGKLYTFFSIKYIFLAAMAIFEIGSAICGAAPNSVTLIIGRAIAGFGSAGLFSGAILIIANTVPLRKRPTYMGLIGGMYGFASVAGPLLGGVFTEFASWRWCFYVNLPLGAVTMLFILIFFHPTGSSTARKLEGNWKEKIAQLDIYGTVVFLPMVVCLLLALEWAGTQYAWSNWRVVLQLCLFSVLVLAFVGIQVWKKEYATIPPRVLFNRSIAAAAWFSLCLGGAFFVMTFYTPIWFQAVKGASPVGSGIRNLPMVLGLVVTSIIAGGLVTWFGYYTPFVIASAVFMSLGAGLLATLTVDTGSPKWIGYQAIFGGGVGFGFQQSVMAVQTVLPNADVPIGTAWIVFTPMLGGAVFVSTAQNVFTTRLLTNLLKVLPGLDPMMVLDAGATQLLDIVPPSLLPDVLVAANDALIGTFYVAAALSSLSVIGAAALEWRSVKGKPIAPVAA